MPPEQARRRVTYEKTCLTCKLNAPLLLLFYKTEATLWERTIYWRYYSFHEKRPESFVSFAMPGNGSQEHVTYYSTMPDTHEEAQHSSPVQRNLIYIRTWKLALNQITVNACTFMGRISRMTAFFCGLVRVKLGRTIGSSARMMHK